MSDSVLILTREQTRCLICNVQTHSELANQTSSLQLPVPLPAIKPSCKLRNHWDVHTRQALSQNESVGGGAGGACVHLWITTDR